MPKIHHGQHKAAIMTAKPSVDDIDFKTRFEAGDVDLAEFHHLEHLKLVYVSLCEDTVERANDRMRQSLTTFLENNDLPASNERETLFSDRARSAFVQPDVAPIPQPPRRHQHDCICHSRRG